VARILNYNNPSNKLAPCDADTVRLVKASLLDSSGTLHSVYHVQWLEHGNEHERRFSNEDAANRYSLQLQCRLQIDVLHREVVLTARLRVNKGGSVKHDQKEAA
jgi:hypothetical protein